MGSYHCLLLSFELEVENWRLTCPDLLYQYFLTLSARFLKPKTFSITKHLSVFCLMWSCFLDATETPLRSNRQKPVIVFLRPSHFLKKNSEAPPKGRQFWKAICQRMNHSDWPRNAFTLSLIGYASTCENNCTPFSELLMTGCILSFSYM